MRELPERDRIERGPTFQRLQRGGIVQNNGAFMVEFPTFIDLLRHRDWIDDGQHAEGVRFIALRESAGVVAGTTRKVSDGTAESEICPMVLYTRILRALKPWELAIINTACWPINWVDALMMLGHRRGYLAEALDVLGKVMNEQKELLAKD
jgi:hypothetical protein